MLFREFFNHAAFYNRMAVLFAMKSTAILKFYYFPLRRISRIRSSLLTNNIYRDIYLDVSKMCARIEGANTVQVSR